MLIIAIDNNIPRFYFVCIVGDNTVAGIGNQLFNANNAVVQLFGQERAGLSSNLCNRFYAAFLAIIHAFVKPWSCICNNAVVTIRTG